MTRHWHEIPLITDEWPPPSVAGANALLAYLQLTGRAYRGPDAVSKRVEDAHLARQLTLLPKDSAVEIGLQGFADPCFVRDSSHGWLLRDDAVRALAIHAVRIGLLASFPDEGRALLEYRELPQALTHYFQEYLRGHQWWLPDRMPALTGVLARFFAQLYAGQELGWEGPFPAEYALAARESTWRADEGAHTPWRDRPRRLWIEIMIAASGRVEPYRLRPVVLITENAGRKRWSYGGWAVYDADVAGHVGALLAIYGKHARFQQVVWHEPEGYSGPGPDPELVRWGGWRFDEGDGRHAEVRCAMTDALLLTWGRQSPEADALPSEAFVPAIPTSLDGLSSEHDTVRRVPVASVVSPQQVADPGGAPAFALAPASDSRHRKSAT
jgi:hypothetical protein